MSVNASSYLRTPLRFLAITPAELSLPATLKCGQAFRWTARPATDLTSSSLDPSHLEWLVGHYDRTLVLRQDDLGIHYRSLYNHDKAEAHDRDVASDTTLDILRTYFVLDVKLVDLLSGWEAKDVNFRRKTKGGRFGGIRVLKQDPWEALVSFICSSNNNIGRITLMLRRICEEYGSPLPEGQYAFPTAESLADDVVEERLRELGFGYRAAYVAHTAEILLESAAENKSSPHATLSSIASLPTSLEQREALQLFSGVGPKVADCVRLFGLGQKAVVPVDVHVARIAARDYNVKCPTASMTKDGYVVVQKALEERWGMFAGWAQQILFAAELAPTTFAATTMTTPVKVKKEAVAYPTPATTPVKRAVELAVELVEAIETKPDVELEACMSLAERTKLRRKRRKV